MTAQIPDIIIYYSEKYFLHTPCIIKPCEIKPKLAPENDFAYNQNIIAFKGNSVNFYKSYFAIEVNPFPKYSSTACYRNYICTYNLDDNGLFILHLLIGDSQYENINWFVPFTGSIALTKKGNLDKELLLKDGKIIESVDW